MTKKNNINTFINEIYSKPPKINIPTNKLISTHFDEVWSIDLADFSDYIISKNKGYRYIFIIIDKFSRYPWTIPLKIIYGETKTSEFSKILSTSKRTPLEIESDRGAKFYNSVFQNFLKSKNIHHYSRFTDERPSIAEGIIRTKRYLLKKSF